MSIWQQKVNSPEINDGRDSPEVMLRYALFGEPTPATAHTTAIANLPATYTGPTGVLYLATFRLVPIGYDAWDIDARYVLPQKSPLNQDSTENAADPEIGRDVTIEGSTGGGTNHITTAFSTEYQAGYDDAGSVTTVAAQLPDFKNSVGVTDRGIEGVDVPAPNPRWKETWTVPNGSFTNAYVMAMEELTGTVNLDTFRGRAAGEVMLIDFTYATQRLGDWKISFEFQRKPSLADQELGDFGPFDKAGWDYIWMRYKDAPARAVSGGGNINDLFRQPSDIVINRVTVWANFALLGIGTAPIL